VKLALDTNAYRALHDGDPELAEETRQAETIGLPLIVLGELRFGFVDGGTRLAQNEARLERLLESPRVEILHPDEGTTRGFAEIAAQLKQDGRPIQQNDMWIAALCKQYDFALATRDKGLSYVRGLKVLTF
jgi:tRNA(fMet)-specific endonuclease VapC